MNDVRYAVRQFLKTPGFTLVAVLTLALGIGGTTAMFSLINSILLKPLPFEEPGKLVHIWEAPSPGNRNSVSPGAFVDWKRESTVFEDISLMNPMDMNLTGGSEPERIRCVGLSASGLRILRARPFLGRLFADGDDADGAAPVATLTHEAWKQNFGGDPGILGKVIHLNETAYMVVGVLEPKFLPWGDAKIVVPINVEPKDQEMRGGHWLQVIARLKPGVSIAAAQAELSSIRRRMASLYPVWKKDWGVTVVAMQEQMTGETRPLLWLLFGAVSCVLLIACANVANLLLAKASGRRKEITVRLALGATRGRLMRQLLTESFTLSLAGAALGVLIALWISSAIAQADAVQLPRGQEIRLDWRVLAFALSSSMVAALCFGVLPAFQAARTDLNESLKEGARGTDMSGGRARSTLIVAEVALALLLMTGGGLLLNSFYRRATVQPGFKSENVLTMQLSMPPKKYADAKARAIFYNAFLDKAETTPGVESVAFVSRVPLARGPVDSLFSIQGRPSDPKNPFDVDFDFCSANYFNVMGIPLLKGRFFDRQEDRLERKVAIVTDALVREYFPNEDPLGKMICMDGEIGPKSELWEIVGVVGDVRRRGLDRRIRPSVYRPMPFAWEDTGQLVARGQGDALALAEPMRRAIASIDPGLPAAEVITLKAVVEKSLGPHRVMLTLLGGFAAIALLLAMVGLYGVIAYTVSQRTREIGIRMALGADRVNVITMILRQGMKLVCLGVIVGILGGIGSTRLMQKLLYEISPTDPLTFAMVSAVLVGVGMVACLLPARKAARIEPMMALRNE